MSSRVDQGRAAADTDRDDQAGSNRLSRILVATDGSPVSAAAVDFALDLASEHGSELVFVHVVPLVDVTTEDALDEPGEAFLHVPTPYDHELLREAAARADEHGIVAQTVLLPGSPVEAIVDHSESCDADLIVVGSHGRGAMASAVLGSVSLGVLKAATRSVLIVRGNDRRQQRVRKEHS